MATSTCTRVCVQGNIGAGKSTVLALLAEREEDVTAVPEQVEAWKPWLALFYAGMEAKGRNTRSFGFHLQILLSFARAHQQKRATPTVVFERSPCCSRAIFVDMAHEHGDIDEPELALYDDMYAELGWQPHFHVYLRCTPEVALARTHQRGRAGEEAITLAYLRALHERHERVYNPHGFTGDVGYVAESHTYIVNADYEPRKVVELLQQVLHRAKHQEPPQFFTSPSGR